ncbi:hypothetical protein HPB50_013594 [Hyalomma asiaticum]|uniref:Uncharacterized protein n=1 Tax=Hyalomma asiaticum TaxID=266040 RepID=A0ACB7SGM2_HYAAI|nr:hypothetical protein HPB50_013594 [Hyalomma asiaticum]
MLRESGCLTVLSRPTLKRYTGVCSGDVVSSLIKQRLHQESASWTDREMKGSLVVDEMAIKQVASYEKKADRVHGLVEMAGLETELGIESELATHLLAFVFVGLSSHYTIPVGYYFTRSTTGEQLHHLKMRVLQSVEEAGFEVVRLVADNHSSNCKMFSILSNGAIQPVVPHPMNENRKLFLTFDHCHILKNLRNQLLASNRLLCDYYSPKYLRMLLDINEKQRSFKPVRRLTRKHVFPTNFEKMNVRRAVDLFSPEVYIYICHIRTALSSAIWKAFGGSGFEDSMPTINFMEMIRKWFNIHNIRSTTFYVISRGPDRMPFSSCDDERLSWLENDFLQFFAAWKETAPHKRAFISMETYEALQITTRSIVESTRFLLRSGFLYVPTAKFSSDPVEALFSTLRQLNRCNDQTDARAVLSSLQKVLSMEQRNQLGEGSSPAIVTTGDEAITESTDQARSSVAEIRILMRPQLAALQSSNGAPPSGIKTSTLALIARFLVKATEDSVKCHECAERIKAPRSSGPATAGIICNAKEQQVVPPRTIFSIFKSSAQCG